MGQSFPYAGAADAVPVFEAQLGVGYIELGFALTVFAVVSGLTQAPMGYLVDHIGARKILLIGLCARRLALIMLGLHLSYPWLIASAVLLGLANSVYHPADYAILSAHMDEARMGRAFSIHTFAGFLGGAVAPAIMAALVTTIGGLGALIVAGAIGPLVALLLIAGRYSRCQRVRSARREARRRREQSIITPALIVLTMFFMLLGLSNAGIGNFGVVALMSGYGATYSTANIALTAYLGASAVGVLAGGFLADRTERHGQVSAVCFAVNAAIVLMIATVALPALLLTAAMAAAGFLGGVIAPSRDMLVRNAAPRRRRAGLRHRLHRLQFLRHREPAVVRLDHGPECAALGVRRLRGLHGAHGCCWRLSPSAARSNAVQPPIRADAALNLIPAG